MACEEWSRKVREYRRAVRTFNNAVDRLKTEANSEFFITWHEAEHARAESYEARAALLHHEHEHCCVLQQACVVNVGASDVLTEDFVLGDQGQSGG